MEFPSFFISADSVTLNFPSLLTAPFPCVFVSPFLDLQDMKTSTPVGSSAEADVKFINILEEKGCKNVAKYCLNVKYVFFTTFT